MEEVRPHAAGRALQSEDHDGEPEPEPEADATPKLRIALLNTAQGAMVCG